MYSTYRHYSISSALISFDTIARIHCPEKIFVAVTIKSRIAVSDSITASFSAGNPSCEKRIEKLALIPPGTGGAAAERTMHITIAVMIQTSVTCMFSCMATLRAANQNNTDTPGLYRICPNGTPKLASFLLTPSLFMQVLILSENAAAEEAVVIDITKVERVLFHNSSGMIFSLIQAAAV
jgi:hypothetical protein